MNRRHIFLLLVITCLLQINGCNIKNTEKHKSISEDTLTSELFRAAIIQKVIFRNGKKARALPLKLKMKS